MRQRRDWFARQLDLDPTRLVFIDETWASTNMARKRGRCRRGRRLRAAVPHGHYKTVTLVAGLRLCGLVAQKAFDRPINAASFEEWVEKCLVPTLSKGDIVVMDNLSSHKGPRVEQLIKAAGAELRYLPPYSPDMNPSCRSRCATPCPPTATRSFSRCHPVAAAVALETLKILRGTRYSRTCPSDRAGLPKGAQGIGRAKAGRRGPRQGPGWRLGAGRGQGGAKEFRSRARRRRVCGRARAGARRDHPLPRRQHEFIARRSSSPKRRSQT